MNSVLIGLIAARTLISYKENWAQYKLAKDKNGKCVNPEDRRAVSWCAIGVCRAVTRNTAVVDSMRNALCNACWDLFHTGFVGDINDIKGHRAVLKIFNQAIARQERKQSC